MQQNYAFSYKKLYLNHWWWRSREFIFLNQIEKLLDKKKKKFQILDVGCGAGLFFEKLKKFGEIWGIENNFALAQSADDPSKIISKDLSDSFYNSWQGKFDLVLALDVLEHIKDDRLAFAQFLSFLKPDGYLLLSVPAMKSLWSHHDEINHHFRRYNIKSLLLISPEIPIFIRYFYHWTVFPKLLTRLFEKIMKRDIQQANVPIGFVNKLLFQISTIEFKLTQYIKIPFGSSLLSIYKRSSSL